VTRPFLAAALVLSATVLPAADSLPRFVDVARQAGVVFRHTNGASAEKHLAETMGSGGLFFDYDSDGWLDIFLVDGGSFASPAVARQARHRLFRNRGNGTYVDVSDRSGIAHRGYGMGACAGDVDGDRRPDLYVTAVGPNTLYRNRGDGVFDDVTAEARVGDPKFGASCAFADFDRDGDLDLWVVNYVATDPARSPYCGDARRRLRYYCHPLNFEPLPSVVYRNDGRGRFTDVSASAGVGRLRSNGLGVVVADYDGDGWPDVFVANDTMPNFLFRNTGTLRFEETGLASGVALAADGSARAGMGIDAGDYDGDGRLDLVITNLDFEMHSLHRGLERGLFAYTTLDSGVGYPTLPFVGFGVAFLDYDNDTRLDIAIANGHILDNAPQYRPGSTYQQRKLLFRNTTGRRFAEVGRSSGTAFAAERVGRGLATGDIDNDGDLDLLVTNNGQDAELLRNDGGGARAHTLSLRLRGAGGNWEAIGARVLVSAGGHTQRRDVTAGSSYLSQSDLRLHIGLGDATQADRIDVRWPSGTVETLTAVPADGRLTIEEGRGIVRPEPTRPVK
jgi:hypothetical protein